MKHLLILISILLLSSLVIGQSSKYESVSQCVLQTMKENKLTGNEMFKMVKEECERILGNSENKGKGNRGVLYFGIRNGKYGWNGEKWEGLEIEDNKDFLKYEGEIKNGLPNGQGTETYTDGTKYVGEYEGGSIINGTVTYPDGRKYVGGFKDGKYNGQGTDTSPYGRKYVGEFKDGLPNGQGTDTYPNGEKYVGKWKNGKRNGQGTFTYPDGRKYEGEWKDDKKHGQGIFTLPGEGYYSGGYKDDKPWNGTLYDINGNNIGKVVNGEQQ
jgi:hypothetical protein